MSESQRPERTTVLRLFEQLARGNPHPLRAACSPEVSWWLPLGAQADREGVAEVERTLLDCLSAGGTVTESVIVAEDGTTAVVEQLVRRAGASTPATSVVTLRDGVVIAGRTYVDVAAWESGHGESDHGRR
jgi:ketosteroid isomerase-like protein